MNSVLLIWNFFIIIWDKKVRQNWQTIRPTIYYFVIETSGVFDCNANVTYFVNSPALKISAYQHIQCAFSFARWRYSDLAVLEPTLIVLYCIVLGRLLRVTTAIFWTKWCNVRLALAFRRKWEVVISSFRHMLSMPMTSTVTTIIFNVTK